MVLQGRTEKAKADGCDHKARYPCRVKAELWCEFASAAGQVKWNAVVDGDAEELGAEHANPQRDEDCDVVSQCYRPKSPSKAGW